jgi:Choline/Carnitine o-acyltransferase
MNHELCDHTKCNSRTPLVYEEIPGCQPPLEIDWAAQDGPKSVEPLGITLNFWSSSLLKLALRLIGIPNLRTNPSAVEALLRSVNLRNNHFAAGLCATAAILDHPTPVEPVDRAAALIMAARSMHRDLITGRFSPDQYKGRNLEMGQYANLFSTNVVFDGHRFQLFKSTCTSQITVLSNNRIYSLDFADLDDSQLRSRLGEALTQITRLSRSGASDPEHSPAVLSAAAAKTQAAIVRKLSEDPVARKSLDTLRHSFITLCLDFHLAPASLAQAAALAHIGNCSNRWYNSALQIVVFGNSRACLIFNYNAYLDGNVQTRAASEIWQRSTMPQCESTLSLNGPRPLPYRELVLPVPPDLISKALDDVNSVRDDQQSTYELTGCGRSFFKCRNLDPVAAFVSALQLAVFRSTRQIPRIWQLLAMSIYRYMDLSRAMVTTREMVRFLHAMEEPGTTPQQRREYLQAAIHSQIALCRTARRHVSGFHLASLLAESKGGARRAYINTVVKATKLLLQVMGLARFGRPDVMISHPRVYNEVPIIGRPGVRLPYLRCFGLHYQILDESIVLTWMPAVNWPITNADLTAALVSALHDVGELGDSA